jgi:hypothetical protein
MQALSRTNQDHAENCHRNIVFTSCYASLQIGHFQVSSWRREWLAWRESVVELFENDN